MCGIGGILIRTRGGDERPGEQVIPEGRLDTLDASIAHRGPDGHGRFRDATHHPDGTRVHCALVHRRLAILDYAGGHQPMVRGRRALVFNGCIYNHRALRTDLAAQGVRFASDHADTEAILGAHAIHGDDLCRHLDGMYAFALWNGEDGTLLLARDIAGEKPLYVGRTGDRHALVFGSALPGVTAILATLDAAPLALDRDRLVAWIRRGAHDDPPFAGVDAVGPGRSLRWMASGAGLDVATSREPLPEREATPRPGRAGAAAGVHDELLRAAITSRLESDVPLGCFLSSGIDSAIVAAHARRALGELRTFTVRMPDPAIDESRGAAETARHLGTTHATLDVAPDPAADLARLLAQLGLPFGDSSLLPTHWVSRAAREHVAVALSGDGADELFFGYERHRAALALARARPLCHVLPPIGDDRTLLGKLARLGRAARGAGYDDLRGIFTAAQTRELLGTDDDPLARAVAHLPAPAVDLVDYLPADLLRKTDTASMAVALEVRSPFLEPSVIGLGRTSARRIFERSIVHPRKALLTAVARRHLPAHIVDRPKRGFAIPIGRWFREDFGGLGAMLQDHLAGPTPFGVIHDVLDIDMAFVRRMLADHMAARRDHAQRLYMLLVLALWSRGLR